MARHGISWWLAAALGAALLGGCRGDERPALSLDEARRVAADFTGPGAALPPRTTADIAAMLDQYKPDPARLAALRAQAEAAPPEGADARQRYVFLTARGIAAGELGLVAQQLADLREAVAIAERDGFEAMRALQQLQIAESSAGNTRSALDYAQRFLAATHQAGRRGGV